MGNKMTMAFANICMAKIQMQILGKGAHLETLHQPKNLSYMPTDILSTTFFNKQINTTWQSNLQLKYLFRCHVLRHH